VLSYSLKISRTPTPTNRRGCIHRSDVLIRHGAAQGAAHGGRQAAWRKASSKRCPGKAALKSKATHGMLLSVEATLSCSKWAATVGLMAKQRSSASGQCQRMTSGPHKLLNLIDFLQQPTSKFGNMLIPASMIYEKF
jgi:hypothetical protein